MALIDASVVNIALPTIGRDLDMGLAGRQWVFLSYSLALASLYLVGGASGDRYGHRRVFTLGTVGFAVASLLAGAAPTGGLLIAARTLQGAAGAFVTTSSLATLRSAYGDESGRAVGLWTAWTGIVSIAGPPVGGALVEFASWRLIFLINLPLAAVVVACARRGVPDVPAPAGERRPFDLVGSVLVAIGFGFLAPRWCRPRPATGRRRRGRRRSPWSRSRPSSSASSAAGTRSCRSRSSAAQLRGGERRDAARLRGARRLGLLPRALPADGDRVLAARGLAGAAPGQPGHARARRRLRRPLDRHGPRLYLSVGPALVAGGILLWSLVNEQSDWWALAAGVLVFSVGLSVTVAPITATALSSAPARLAGIASGVNNTVSRLGGLLAVGGIGLVIASSTRHAPGSGARPLTERPGSPLAHDASVAAFRAGMLVAAALALAGSLVAGVWISNREALVRKTPAAAGAT